ncbi:MAG: hypothetical protein LUG49_05495, partial [Oscillospiraceae bacterium]|nr:hypothetical protein [Oscillospiraceae bacterium]
MKKFLSILIALVLCVCTFTTTLFATEPIDSSGIARRFTVAGNLGSLYASLSITGEYDKIAIYEYGSAYASFGSKCSISDYIYGIYATGKSTVLITGGIYSSNYVGIYINNSNVTFTLSGAPVISGNSYKSGTETVNCNVYLDDGALITLGELTDGASIGITTNTKPTAGNPVQITTTETNTELYKTAVQYFFSDDPNYVVRVSKTGKYLELSVPDCKVTASTAVENGSIAVSTESAGAGEIVTVTPTADLGYEVDTITYTYNNGTEDFMETITADNSGIHSFTMPAYDVTVNATFKQTVYSISESGDSNGTVTISPESAVAGTTVIVTPNAAEGYEVDTVSYTYNDGTEDFTETITADNSGIYRFTMPYYAV